MVRLFALVCGIVLGSACGSSLPGPESATHPSTSFVEVPYPPPAALVEVVPKRPDGNAVWVDGSWAWRGRSYVWQRGGWVHAPEDAAYAGWQASLAADGRLLFAPGAWYDAARRPVDAPPQLRTARTPPNQITLESEVAR
jgi:WXXGXW repeat (2 copies)